VEEAVVGAGLAGAFHHDHLVAAFEVVAQGLGPHDRALLVGAGEELLGEVPPQPELGLGQAPQAGELHGQHGGPVLERHFLGFARLSLRVNEGEHAEHVLPGVGQGQQPSAVPDRLARIPSPA
jgi:hypothetical protein